MSTLVTFKPHLTFCLEQMKGSSAIDLSTATLKMALFTSSATININSTTAYTTTNEVTGTGYTAGGITISNTSVVVDDSNASIELRGDAVMWAQNGAGFTNARYVVIYCPAVSNRIIASGTLGSDYGITIYPIIISNAQNELVKFTRSTS